MVQMPLQSVLSDTVRLRDLGGGVVSALPSGATAPYDRWAGLYDAVVGRSVYHRVMWGTSAGAFRRFARLALDAAGDGCFAEIGCGSLLFSAPLYATARPPLVVLADLSEQMLRRAARRLAPRGGLPEPVHLLHADIGSLPMRPGSFESLLCLNVLHVSCDLGAIATEAGRLLAPGRGRLFVSALVRSGRWSDRYMAALHQAGEFGPPLPAPAFQERIAVPPLTIESARSEGNMHFLTLRNAG